MKCRDLAITGVSYAAAGLTVLLVRQTFYANDVTLGGRFIGILGGISLIGGLGTYGLSTSSDYCEK